MNRRFFVAFFAIAGMLAGAAHAQAPAPTPAAPKIAISSLIGDALTITVYREAGSNLSNTSSVIKMPGPMLDIVLLKAAQEALGQAAPGADLFPLKVAMAGSPTDPAAAVADGKVVADNVLVDALRKQGFTHLLTATKHRQNIVIRLANGPINAGKGQLEGLGFYLDPSLKVVSTAGTTRSEGIVAPYAYFQLRLIDLATLEMRVHSVVANTVAAAAQNKEGTDAWGALTAAEKFKASESLIKEQVANGVPALFAPK